MNMMKNQILNFIHQEFSLKPETLKYIWGSWLPKSNYEYVEKPDFELYSPGIRPEDPDHILFLYIPVSRKS